MFIDPVSLKFWSSGGAKDAATNRTLRSFGAEHSPHQADL